MALLSADGESLEAGLEILPLLADLIGLAIVVSVQGLGTLLVVAVLLTRRRSYWVLAVPVVGAVLWWGVVSAGEKWLDWSG